jgi:hypothetical protein
MIQQFLGRPRPLGLQIEACQPHLGSRVLQRIHAHLPRAQRQQAFEFACGAAQIPGFLERRRQMIQPLGSCQRIEPRRLAMDIQRAPQEELRLGVVAVPAQKHPQVPKTLRRLGVLGSEHLFGQFSRLA